mmetsp:Transcript_15521/g.25067  ORF Transcript_15521/g.25067 Transcript_15521/m.25067 type:complete len:298 (-) Transcript_15521:13-906(-)
MMMSAVYAVVLSLTLSEGVKAFAPSPLVLQTAPSQRSSDATVLFSNRRDFISNAAIAVGSASGILISTPQSALADVDTDSFIKTGMVSMPMGVSGQAGKAKPVTGVVLRDGSEVSRDKSGNVLSEILLGKSSEPTPVLATFSSPWPLAKGGLFDVECRDAQTGDGAFLTVASAKGKSVADLPKTFFTDSLFSSTGRFSFYGAPTDVRVKKSDVDGPYRYLEIVFSNLSQSTNAEIPRTALVAATIPEGTDYVVMLVGSSTSNRWKRGAEKSVRETVGSFKATLAPTSGLKARAKERV